MNEHEAAKQRINAVNAYIYGAMTQAKEGGPAIAAEEANRLSGEMIELALDACCIPKMLAALQTACSAKAVGFARGTDDYRRWQRRSERLISFVALADRLAKMARQLVDRTTDPEPETSAEQPPNKDLN